MTIKLWNWEKNWQCEQVFEGHTHYVMQIVFNPKDNNTFASASLDRTIKVTCLNCFFNLFVARIQISIHIVMKFSISLTSNCFRFGSSDQ